MKHRHKPNSLEYLGIVLIPTHICKWKYYFSFSSAAWSPVDTHSHCLVGKEGRRLPTWDEKVTLKLKRQRLILHHLKLGKSELTSTPELKAEESLLLLILENDFFARKASLTYLHLSIKKDNWGFHAMQWSDWFEVTYQVHPKHTVQEAVISISQPITNILHHV